MQKLTLLNTSLHITTLCSSTRGSTFCVIAEANEKDPQAYGKDSRFERLLYDAAALLLVSLEPETLPSEMAKAIQAVLIEWHKKGFGAGTVMYTGVLITPEKIHLCTAGDCRVHLIKGDKLVAVTRDHNLIDDPEENSPTPDDELLRQVYLGATTRTIGVLPSVRKPECLTWEATGANTVLICSSRFHRYRKPGEYLDPFLAGKDLNLSPSDKTPPGVIIRIDSLP